MGSMNIKELVEKMVIILIIIIVIGTVYFAIRRSFQLNPPKPVWERKVESELISHWMENGLHRVDYEGKVYLIYVSGGTGTAIIEHKADLE